MMDVAAIFNASDTKEISFVERRDVEMHDYVHVMVLISWHIQIRRIHVPLVHHTVIPKPSLMGLLC